MKEVFSNFNNWIFELFCFQILVQGGKFSL